MSDWNYINKFREREGRFGSDDSYGMNGLFRFPKFGKKIKVIASDGMGWQHVSVSLHGENATPSWEVMCWIKELFFEPEDWVVQFHPAKSQYVNCHPGCLHLWRSLDKSFPVPDSIMVGPKTNSIAVI